MKRIRPVTLTIGILPSGQGVGATYTAVLIANYLCSFERYRVAVIELGEPGRLKSMLTKELIIGNGIEGFTYKGVDYYPSKSIHESNLFTESKYDFLIYIFRNCSEDNIKLYSNCYKRILLGSVSEWRYKEYQELFKFIYSFNADPSDWDCYGKAVNKRESKKFFSEFNTIIRELPSVKDPFSITRKECESIRELLPEEASIKRQGGGIFKYILGRRRLSYNVTFRR